MTPEGAPGPRSGRDAVFTRNQSEADTPSLTVLLHWFDRLRAAKTAER